MRKKRILTAEHKAKIGRSQKGQKRVFSDAAIANIRKAAAKRKGIPTGPRSDEIKEKIRLATTGKKKICIKPNSSKYKKGHVPENPFKKGNIPWNNGTKGNNYKVIGKYNYRIRAFIEFDNSCKICLKEENLQVHHIDMNRENSEIENLMILCASCHRKIHVLYKKGFTHKQSFLKMNEDRSINDNK